MNRRYRWECSKREWPAGSEYAGWRLFSVPTNTHLGTVYVDGSWYCAATDDGDCAAGSQPLAAQALLRAAGVEP